MFTKISSTTVTGAAYSIPNDSRVCSGSGSARRSTFPFGVNGSSLIDTSAVGIMYCGNFSPRDARISLIVNRANTGIAVADVERTTGMRAFATIRSGGPLFVRAANEGVTVVEKFPKEKVTEDFEHLADRLLDRGSPVAAKGSERGFLGLFARPQAEVVRA